MKSCPLCKSTIKLYFINSLESLWFYCPNCNCSGIPRKFSTYKCGIRYPDKMGPISIDKRHYFARLLYHKFGVKISDIITEEKLLNDFATFLFLKHQALAIPFFDGPNYISGAIIISPRKIGFFRVNTKKDDVGIGFGNDAIVNNFSDIFILSISDSIKLRLLAAQLDEDNILKTIVTAFIPQISILSNKRNLFSCSAFSFITGQKHLLINISEHDLSTAIPALLWAERIGANVYYYSHEELESAPSVRSFLSSVTQKTRLLSKKPFISQILEDCEIKTDFSQINCNTNRVLLTKNILLEKVNDTWFSGIEQVLNFDIINVCVNPETGQWEIEILFDGNRYQLEFFGSTALQIYKNFVSVFSSKVGRFPLCKLSAKQFLEFIKLVGISVKK